MVVWPELTAGRQLTVIEMDPAPSQVEVTL
jgi:hypothetical protein